MRPFSNIHLLSTIARLWRRCTKQRTTPEQFWKERTTRYGRRAVLNITHSESEYDLVTTAQKEILFPIFTAQLNGKESSLLDYGCGPGRFTEDLAKIIGGNVVGMDICQQLIEFAPQSSNIQYRFIENMKNMVADKEYDVIWICLVLGGISEKEISSTASFINDSLSENGLLFLIENTATNKKSNNWLYRSESKYKELFPRIDLKKIGGYSDCDEKISIMSGRKKPSITA